MDGDRDEAVRVAGVGGATARNWREAVKALSREPLPPKLRLSLTELGALGSRFRLAVEAYDGRVARAMADPAERELPISACRAWPEHAERAAAREAYDEAKEIVAVEARAWVEGSASAPAPGSEA